MRCSPAEEAFSSQALLSLLHNALSKALGKMLVKDAYLEKFNQCLIIDGYLIAKVVPDDNELVLNNDELCLITLDRCLIITNLCLTMMNRCLMIKTNT